MANTATPPTAALMQRLRSPAVLGVLVALGAVVAYGTSQVLQRKLVTSVVSPPVGAALSVFFGMLFLFAASFPRLGKDLRAPKRTLGFALLAGLFSSIGVLATYFAFSYAPVVVVSPITSLNPLFAIFLSMIFLRRLEKITPRVIMGTALVVAGVVLVVVGSRL